MAKRFKEFRANDSDSDWQDPKKQDRLREKQKKRNRSEVRKQRISEKNKFLS